MSGLHCLVGLGTTTVDREGTQVALRFGVNLLGLGITRVALRLGVNLLGLGMTRIALGLGIDLLGLGIARMALRLHVNLYGLGFQLPDHLDTVNREGNRVTIQDTHLVQPHC